VKGFDHSGPGWRKRSSPAGMSAGTRFKKLLP
jgi:hypothetical protein